MSLFDVENCTLTTTPCAAYNAWLESGGLRSVAHYMQNSDAYLEFVFIGTVKLVGAMTDYAHCALCHAAGYFYPHTNSERALDWIFTAVELKRLITLKKVLDRIGVGVLSTTGIDNSMITINLLPNEVPHRHAKRGWCVEKRTWKHLGRNSAVILAQSALLVHLSVLGAFLVPARTVHADTLALNGDTGESGALVQPGEQKPPPTTALLTVHSALDTNGDGTQDQQDVPGWTWNIDGAQQNIAAGTNITLPVGTYTIAENIQAGFQIKGLVCDGTPLGASLSASITLTDTGTDCTFTNVTQSPPPPPTGTITVHANVDTDGNGIVDTFDVADWTWNADGGPTIATGSSSTLVTQTHTISENVQLGFHVTDLTCNGTSFGAVASTSLNLTSDGINCTFTNTKTLTPPSATIALQKSAPATVNAGDNITYTLTWGIAGADVTNAIITDPVPANTTFVSATDGGILASGAVSWDLGSRTAGETGTVTYTVKTASPIANGTVITNTATFDTTETDPATASASTKVNSASTLSLTKTDNPDSVQPSEPIVYTFNWSVNGTNPVTNLTLTDPLPSGLTFVSASNGGTFANGTVTWLLGSHQPGDSGTVTVTTTVGISVANGTVVTNTATLSSAETPAVSASQTTAVTSPAINIPPAGPVMTTLSVAKSVDLAFANPGDTANYTVNVKNTGTAKAINVVLTDTLPAGLTFVDGGTSTKTFTIGDLGTGVTATVLFAVKVSATQAAGTYTSTASVKADNASAVTATANLEIRIPVVLGVTTTEHRAMTLTKSVSKTEHESGDTFHYTLVLNNTGNVELTNVRIHDTLPTGFHYSDTGSSKRVWAIGTLMIGEIRTIRYDVSIDKNVIAGKYDNKATASADVTPSQHATSTVAVHAPKVLGATTSLPATGADWKVPALFALAFSLIVTSLWGMARLVPRQSWS